MDDVLGGCQVAEKAFVPTQTGGMQTSPVNTNETQTITVAKSVFTLSEAPQAVRDVRVKTSALFEPMTKVLQKFVTSCVITCSELRKNTMLRNVSSENVVSLNKKY